MVSNILDSLILDKLKDGGVNFFVSVPCKLLTGIIKELEKDEDVTYLPVTREEEGFGICAGAFLGGKSPCIVMQNSGLGNSINALASLIQLYRIPIVMLISHRGTPGEKIGAQFQMGSLTDPLLKLLQIPSYPLRTHEQVRTELSDIARHARVIEYPVAVLLDFKFWSTNHETI